MKSFIRSVALLAVLAPAALAQQQSAPANDPRWFPPAAASKDAAPPAPKLSPGSKVFIEPAGGFETYLAAALQKKKVPVQIVSDKEHADFTIRTASEQTKASWAKIIVWGDTHADEQASITVSDAKSSVVVFAYAFSQHSSFRGFQTSAESCAKHLGEFIKTGKDDLGGWKARSSN